MRRPYQIGRAHWEVFQRGGSWWVREEWTEIGTRGDKVDEFRELGPFAAEQEAWAKFNALCGVLEYSPGRPILTRRPEEIGNRS